MAHFNRITGYLKLVVFCVFVKLRQQLLCLCKEAAVSQGKISSGWKYVIAIISLKIWGIRALLT